MLAASSFPSNLKVVKFATVFLPFESSEIFPLTEVLFCSNNKIILRKLECIKYSHTAGYSFLNKKYVNKIYCLKF